MNLGCPSFLPEERKSVTSSFWETSHRSSQSVSGQHEAGEERQHLHLDLVLLAHSFANDRANLRVQIVRPEVSRANRLELERRHIEAVQKNGSAPAIEDMLPQDTSELDRSNLGPE